MDQAIHYSWHNIFSGQISPSATTIITQYTHISFKVIHKTSEPHTITELTTFVKSLLWPNKQAPGNKQLRLSTMMSADQDEPHIF